MFTGSPQKLPTLMVRRSGQPRAKSQKFRIMVPYRVTPVSYTHLELFKASRPRVRQNRLLMNKPEGYWALDISDRWLGQVQRETLPLAALRSFVLMTDGFDRLVEPFRRYTDEQLLRRLEDVGVSAMLDELRCV